MVFLETNYIDTNEYIFVKQNLQRLTVLDKFQFE